MLRTPWPSASAFLRTSTPRPPPPHTRRELGRLAVHGIECECFSPDVDSLYAQTLPPFGEARGGALAHARKTRAIPSSGWRLGAFESSHCKDGVEE